MEKIVRYNGKSCKIYASHSQPRVLLAAISLLLLMIRVWSRVIQPSPDPDYNFCERHMLGMNL